MCDVDAAFYGPKGAAWLFGPQGQLIATSFGLRRMMCRFLDFMVRVQLWAVIIACGYVC